MDKDFKRFCTILHICANYISAYAGDILLDLPRMWDDYTKGKWPVLTIRKTGADRIERFEDCLVETGAPHEFADCVECAKHTLGVDFYIEITPYLVKLTNVSLDKGDVRQMKARFEVAGAEVELC